MEYSAELAVRSLIRLAGDSPDREGLKETPERVVRAYAEMFSGYKVDIPSLFKTFDEAKNDEMIVVSGIRFMSFCEHHMLPIIGCASVGYIPSDSRVVGLSKIARLVDAFAKRLQVQERLTSQITEAIQANMGPKGVGCVIHAKHLCLCGRGPTKRESVMTTSSMLGVFRDKPEVRAEFMALANQPNAV